MLCVLHVCPYAGTHPGHLYVVSWQSGTISWCDKSWLLTYSYKSVGAIVEPVSAVQVESGLLSFWVDDF